MVQNEQQYICIHQCLLAVINGEETSPSYGQQPGGNNQGFEGKIFRVNLSLSSLVNDINLPFSHFSSFPDDEGIQEGPP